MNSPKLTEWFGPDVKPTIPGVYQVKRPVDRDAAGAQYWNGKHWCCFGMTHQRALEFSLLGRSLFQNHEWRGLASDPSKESSK